MNEVIEALNALYFGSDPNCKKKADEYLRQWQQTQSAWQISNTILSNQGARLEIYYFAAQTLRTKIQFDFYELPGEAYMSLRDSLVSHILRYRGAENGRVLTQLCLALADLAIQLANQWTDVVQFLVEKFAHSPENFAALLEILQYLPEECMNDKLMCDQSKRAASSVMLRQVSNTVSQFILQVQCPSVIAKKKVFECFLSWLKFMNVPPAELASNHILLSCFDVLEDATLSDVATEIIVKVIDMTGKDTKNYEPVIQCIMPRITKLKCHFAKYLENPDFLNTHEDLILILCRIFTQCGESYLQTMLDQNTVPEVQEILKIICLCTSMPNDEISSIPINFWYLLGYDIYHHPEVDSKMDQFKNIFIELLEIAIKQVTLRSDRDPFSLDDDYISYRHRFLAFAEDCLTVVTPNAGLEVVLKSLQANHSGGILTQEAHFFMLSRIATKAVVDERSLFYDLLQSLPQIISKSVSNSLADRQLIYYKCTAIDLLGKSFKWLREKNDLMRAALEMMSSILIKPLGEEADAERQLQNHAAISFRFICIGSGKSLVSMVSGLCQLYTATLAGLSCKYHLYVLEGVVSVVNMADDDKICIEALTHICKPLIQAITPEQEKGVLCEIYDRLVTVIRYLRVHASNARGAAVGELITTHFWPLVQSSIATHAADGRVVEKCCRFLKHSMRCVPKLFKPLVEPLATMLVQKFDMHQHSSYLYSAEILANTFNRYPECLPTLSGLFHHLSETALRVLNQQQEQLHLYSELVEDFYGMFERYLRYVPEIVLQSPTLPAALQMSTRAVHVMQKDASDATFSFLEAIYYIAVEGDLSGDPSTQQQRLAALKTVLINITPSLLRSLFDLLVNVPPAYIRGAVVKFLEMPKLVFTEEWKAWIPTTLQVIPQSAMSNEEKEHKLLPLLINTPPNRNFDPMTPMGDALLDVAYRCEQVALRNRNQRPEDQKGQ